MCDHVLKVCEHNVLQITLGNFTIFTFLGTIGTPIRFLRQKVIVQGHNETTSGQISNLGGIFTARPHCSQYRALY